MAPLNTLSTCLLLLFALTPPLITATDFNVIRYGAVGDGETDDTQAFVKAWKAACTASGVSILLVPGCRRYLVHPIIFHGPCLSEKIKFKVEGTIAAPRNPSEWICADIHCDSWLVFKQMHGLVISGSGTIDGNAHEWWKLGRVKDYRPNALVVTHSDNVELRDLNFKDNPHMHVVFYKCNGVKISNIDISADGLSPNTDGIHLRNVINATIEYCSIGTGDDCISMADGTKNVDVNHVNCGPGHGISIGSLGKDGKMETVENVHVKNAKLVGTTNGVRIKTWQGGRGFVRNVVFEKIRTDNAELPITIDQFYCDYEDEDLRHQHCSNKNGAVKISDISFIDVRGTSSESAVVIACSDTSACTDIRFEDIHLEVDQSDSLNTAVCLNVHGVNLKGEIKPPLTCD